MKLRHYYSLFIIHLSLGCLAAALASCGGNSEEEMRMEEMRADSAALKIATMPTLDCLPLYVAKMHGLTEQEGLDLRLVPFASQMDQDTALIQGRVEGIFTDTVRANRLESKEHLRLHRIAETPLTWQLFSSRNAKIKQLKQLDDKMLAMTRYSATDLLSQMVVDSAKVKPTRVFRIQINDVNIRYDMLAASTIDAAWLPEPFATKARKAGYKPLYASDNSLNVGVLVLDAKAMSDSTRTRQMEALVKVYNQAVDTISRQGLARYRQLISEYSGVAEKDLQALPKKISFTKAKKP